MFYSRFVLVAVIIGGALAAPASNNATTPASSAPADSSSIDVAPGTPAAKPSSVSVSSTESSSAPASSFTAGLTSDDPNDSLLDQFQSETPEAIRGSLGATVIGPQNVALDRQSPDFLAPPSTDAGSVDNAKWPFSLSHNRLQTGGWARQENIGVMPLAEEMAGVNMRLQAGAIRELHWHATAEWAYVLKGTTRITALTPKGQNYEADVNAGDVWYFPAGIPHSLQATNDTAEGSEFLLVFDSGDFSEDDTFLLTDWMAHIPKEILAKNFKADISAFDHIPAKELYIFPSSPPPPVAQDEVSDPQGHVTTPFSFAWSNSSVTPLAGGSAKVLDSTTFAISQTIAAADITVDVGGMRELHWHPTQAEWSYFISGQARVTIFAANGNARTFNYEPGDVGYVPASNGHYVENIGNDTLHFLEIFKTDQFQDISLNQWLALTPPELVKAHLNIDDATVSLFNKTKQTVV
ncbi:oxalate decarboxylase [Ramaria rubella]|nr:oxalate decarboxylase [Ramaria rubella]